MTHGNLAIFLLAFTKWDCQCCRCYCAKVFLLAGNLLAVPLCSHHTLQRQLCCLFSAHLPSPPHPLYLLMADFPTLSTPWMKEEATIMEAREVRTTQVEEVRNVMEKIELNKGQDDPLSTSEGQVEHAGNKTSKGSSRGRVFGESHKKTKMVPEASRSRPKKKRPLVHPSHRGSQWRPALSWYLPAAPGTGLVHMLFSYYSHSGNRFLCTQLNIFF
ncbi:uncharacterized protein LOC120732086 [Simochromis diagramma]|uniref:uncharacterized protein LOC120732086 n=1 Tax=Simochromis diagramma TaxID=43689 RepID=UPI001A7EAFBB|nr:uncharacterized protein LOC120732086 [Simochromis diagramma]